MSDARSSSKDHAADESRTSGASPRETNTILRRDGDFPGREVWSTSSKTQRRACSEVHGLVEEEGAARSAGTECGSARLHLYRMSQYVI
jgi:hypothetical protein